MKLKNLSSSEIKSCFYAIMLADSFTEVNTNSGKARLDIYHSSKNEDYMKMKTQIFMNIKTLEFSVKEKIDSRPLKNGGVRQGFRCITKFSNYIYTLHNVPFKVKVKGIINNPLALAILWQDDGTCYVNQDGVYKYANICVESWTIEQCKIFIQAWNDKFGWSPKLAFYQSRNKTYHRLSIMKSEMQQFSDHIREYVVDSMQYKILK
jgi:hypothetical protein